MTPQRTSQWNHTGIVRNHKDINDITRKSERRHNVTTTASQGHHIESQCHQLEITIELTMKSQGRHNEITME